MARTLSEKRVRYAVVGLGHFAQASILPAFEHAPNSELVALISGDPAKREKIPRQYKVPFSVDYGEYEAFLQTGEVDAVYIALPNHLHAEFAIRAANAGVHVLCEKPMAVTVDECKRMISACKKAGVKLMTAYRLHFEGNNLQAADLVGKGTIGDPKLFASTFTMTLREGNVRGRPVPGAGPLYDIGTYCINAARYLFHDEPEEVFAMPARGAKQVACVLRFPEGRLATFVVSFEGFHDSRFEVVGTKGILESNPAFQHAGELKQTLTVGNRVKEKKFPDRDQVAAELIAFSDCILQNKEPEPSGEEGLIDVRIIEALQASAREKHPIRLPRARKRTRPSARQERRVRSHRRKPKLVKVASPSKR